MFNHSKLGRKTSDFVNWGTVWGLIFAAIALDIYINYREHTQDKEKYRTQYEAKASEADSLRAVKNELERQLLKVTQSPSTSSIEKLPAGSPAVAAADNANQ
ncbi:hypothetical protein GCM10027347_24190 [Larkinella harenae]